jgi:hypothetical protein
MGKIRPQKYLEEVLHQIFFHAQQAYARNNTAKKNLGAYMYLIQTQIYQVNSSMFWDITLHNHCYENIKSYISGEVSRNHIIYQTTYKLQQ